MKNIERSVLMGVPEEVLNFARKNKIDLIIMGTHGEPGSTGPVRSTARRVVRYAPYCSYRKGSGILGMNSHAGIPL
jgi:nucleotide-binding universal stress UspA family protein